MSSNEKPSSKQLAICPSNIQTVTSPLDILNRYQILGQISKPSYQSILATYPFSQNLTMQPQHQYQPPASRTNYLLKPNSTNLFAKELVHKNISHPHELVKSIFPTGWHFSPLHSEKSITFYRDILYDHKSVVIKPIFDRNDSSKIIYHSLYIHNIVSLDEWGHPSLLKTLPNHSIQYSYYDYMEAWFKVILHQNKSYSHSWFFSFDHKFKSTFFLGSFDGGINMG